MKLLYKTRGSATPQGKPRVYFTGHPKDFEPYFDEITDDILKSQNCAVYYDAEPDADYDEDELLRELEQMQLFVIPVTSRFLFQRNRALDVEFPFAMEHHIPVLPFVQEGGLEETFNEKCGDLQMLDKHSQDNTALPFEEKLEKFLASVLVGDELAEKVRAAFDAYVFLSYRKKDRRYAQELMRLIHKNDFCRDIAIWYDEFLTPGENFNEAIGAVLEKCGLFALAVTPSLLEENNYVMTTEYPEARKSGKTILPAELVTTDKDALRACYRDIPPCTDAYDEKALSSALLESLRGLAIRENDGSPEHNFFIGLAYLNGIDVEVDRRRALSLIRGAAEAELPEAVEKLVSMYRSGDGVKRDYLEAIRWQERLAEHHKKRFEETDTESDGLDWAYALWDLGDYWEELARLSEAKDAYREMHRISRLLAERFESNDARRSLSVSYDKLGKISDEEGQLEEAKGYYLQSLELRKEFCGESPTAETRRDIFVSYGNLGKISDEEGQPEEAKGYYLRSMEIARELCRESPTAQARRDLTISYNNLGGVSEEEGQLEEAKEYYQKSLEIARQLCEESPTAEIRRDLSISYNLLGDISKEEGQLEEAKGYYLKSLEVARELSQDVPTIEIRRDLAIRYDNLGKISEMESQLEEAKGYHLKSLEIVRKLCCELPTVQARMDLSINYDNLGNISAREGHLEEARKYYQQSLELRKELCEEAPTVQARRILSVSYFKLGVVSEEEGQLEEAKGYYLQFFEIDKELCKESPTVQSRMDLSVGYEMLGNVSEEEDRLEEAKEYYQKALEITRDLCTEVPTAEIRRKMSRSFLDLGDISRKEGQLEEAKRYYQKSLEIARALCGESPTAQFRRNLSVIYYKLGDISQKEGQLVQAKEYYLRALGIRRQLKEETQTVQARADLVSIGFELGGFCGKSGNKEDAKTYYTIAAEAAKEQYDSTGDSKDYDQLAYLYYNIALIGDGATERLMITQAYEIWDYLGETYPDQPQFLKRKEMAKARLDQLEESC